MKFLVLVSTLFAVTRMTAQVNFIQNPGFEIFDTCPDAGGQVSRAYPWFYPTLGTSDFLHACAPANAFNPVNVPNTFMGNSSTHSGNGMAGIYTAGGAYYPVAYPYREYLGIKLRATLGANQRYYVSFYVKLASSCCDYAGNQMSMFFSKNNIHKTTADTITAIPQIENPATNFIVSSTSWTKISGSFVATGEENYAFIGNFHPFVTNDTLYNHCRQIATQPPFYSLYYYVDDVCVSLDPQLCGVVDGYRENVLSESVKIYPNPTSGHIKIEMDNFSQVKCVAVKNVHGITVKEMYPVNSSLDLSPLDDGIYFIMIDTGVYKIHKRIVIKN